MTSISLFKIADTGQKVLMLWQFYPWFNSYYPLFRCIVQCNVDNEPRIKLNRNIEGPARFPQFVNAGLCSSSARGLRLLTFVCGRLEKCIFA